jgi:hypothetical protein
LGPAEVQRHPWNGDIEVGPGAGPSARLAPPSRRVLSSVDALSTRSALSFAAPPVAVASATTTATAATDEEDDDPVPFRRCGSHRSRASAAPSAACASTEAVVIDDHNDDDKGPFAQSARGPRPTPLSGTMRTAVLAAALASREGLGCYLVRFTRAETFRLPALKLAAAKLSQNAEEEVVVAAEEAPGWLLVGVRLPAPDPEDRQRQRGSTFTAVGLWRRQRVLACPAATASSGGRRTPR